MNRHRNGNPIVFVVRLSLMASNEMLRQNSTGFSIASAGKDRLFFTARKNKSYDTNSWETDTPDQMTSLPSMTI